MHVWMNIYIYIFNKYYFEFHKKPIEELSNILLQDTLKYCRTLLGFGKAELSVDKKL